MSASSAIAPQSRDYPLPIGGALRLVSNQLLQRGLLCLTLSLGDGRQYVMLGEARQVQGQGQCVQIVGSLAKLVHREGKGFGWVASIRVAAQDRDFHQLGGSRW